MFSALAKSKDLLRRPLRGIPPSLPPDVILLAIPNSLVLGLDILLTVPDAAHAVTTTTYPLISRSFTLLIIAVLGAMTAPSTSRSAVAPTSASIPLELRRQVLEAGKWRTTINCEEVLPNRLAIVVIDMWERHHCAGMMREEMALLGPMNTALDAARRLGIQVVFLPSDVLEFYREYPQRRVMQALPRHALPAPVAFNPPEPPHNGWVICGCAADQPCRKNWPAWQNNPMRRQHPDLRITEPDLIGDCNTAQELYSLCAERGITHLVYCGVAANMCVLGRGAGMAAMTRLGFKCLILRDLTAAMYGSPYDAEFTWVDVNAKAVEHIERNVGASLESLQLLEAARRATARDQPQGGLRAGVDPDYRHAPAEAREQFADLKFGMRIVWGQNTALGLNWDGPMRQGQSSEEFRKLYLTLYQIFNPTGFSADEWASLAARAGMRYALTTTKMHSGFCLWPTRTTTRALRRTLTPSPGPITAEEANLHYDVMDTPFQRNVVKELVDAFRKRGLPMGIHFSHVDWNDPRFAWDFNSRYYKKSCPADLTPSTWYEQHRAQILELAGGYGPLLQISFDTGGIPMPQANFAEIVKTVKLVRELQPNCLFRNRGLGDYGDYGTPEGWIPTAAGTQRKVDDSAVEVWEHIDFLAGLWGWWPGDNRWKPKEWLVNSLIEAVSKGGNFMPSVSPMPNGKFPPEVIERLEYVGDWLKVNGEAIYATRPRPGEGWKEGPDFRFTRSKDNGLVYAISLKWPGRQLRLKSVHAAPDRPIFLLGVKEPLPSQQDESGLVIEIPESLQVEQNRPCLQAYAFKIENQ